MRLHSAAAHERQHQELAFAVAPRQWASSLLTRSGRPARRLMTALQHCAAPGKNVWHKGCIAQDKGMLSASLLLQACVMAA